MRKTIDDFIKIVTQGKNEERYDLFYVRIALKRLRTSNNAASISLIAKIDNLQKEVDSYLHRSFRLPKATSDCKDFCDVLMGSKHASPATIDELISAIGTSVTCAKLYHVTFTYASAGAGHHFALLLRPNRRPYILQEEKNTYTLREYVLFNLIRGNTNPLSKEPEKVIAFLKSAQQYHQVNRNLFLYMFGYLWNDDVTSIPIGSIFVRNTISPNSRCDLNSLYLCPRSGRKITNGSSGPIGNRTKDRSRSRSRSRSSI